MLVIVKPSVSNPALCLLHLLVNGLERKAPAPTEARLTCVLSATSMHDAFLRQGVSPHIPIGTST